MLVFGYIVSPLICDLYDLTVPKNNINLQSEQPIFFVAITPPPKTHLFDYNNVVFILFGISKIIKNINSPLLTKKSALLKVKRKKQTSHNKNIK